MNENEFKQLLDTKRALAVELYEELILKRGNLPNKFLEVAYKFYDLYHDALYDPESEYYFFCSYDAHISEFRRNEVRLSEFRAEKDYKDFIAVEVFLKIDNGELEDL